MKHEQLGFSSSATKWHLPGRVASNSHLFGRVDRATRPCGAALGDTGAGSAAHRERPARRGSPFTGQMGKCYVGNHGMLSNIFVFPANVLFNMF